MRYKFLLFTTMFALALSGTTQAQDSGTIRLECQRTRDATGGTSYLSIELRVAEVSTLTLKLINEADESVTVYPSKGQRGWTNEAPLVNSATIQWCYNDGTVLRVGTVIDRATGKISSLGRHSSGAPFSNSDVGKCELANSAPRKF